jgi:hypothetical protein
MKYVIKKDSEGWYWAYQKTLFFEYIIGQTLSKTLDECEQKLKEFVNTSEVTDEVVKTLEL